MLRQSSHIIFLSILLVLVSCPNPPEETICGQGMILVNETCECVPNSHPSDDGESCECDTLYYWNINSEQCILDTTSSDFIWVFDSLGAYGSQIFDAAIINDNDIWLAGEIYVWELDTATGIVEEELYNAIHWDGFEWSLHVGYGVNNAPLKSVFAFSSDDVWFVNGIDIIHYDGNTFERLWQVDVEQHGFDQVMTIWGSSPNNMYFAGYRGNIVHYDGSTFTHIATNIDTDFRDITGTPDGEHVFVLGNPKYRHGVDLILHSAGDPLNWEWLYYPPDSTDVEDLLDTYSTSVVGDKLYTATEFDIWIYDIATSESELITDIDHIERLYRFTASQSENDIFFGGSKFDYIHYNGSGYQYVNEIQQNYSTTHMKGGDFKNNMAIMVGYFNSWEHALVARGYR